MKFEKFSFRVNRGEAKVNNHLIYISRYVLQLKSQSEELDGAKFNKISNYADSKFVELSLKKCDLNYTGYLYITSVR